MTGKKMEFRSVAAAGLCLLAASAVQARAADQLPFAYGRWTLSQDEQVSPEALTKLCANPLAWMDITAETYATGGSATDAQTCLAPRWRRINAKTVEGTPRKCNPALDSLGDPAGPLRVVAISANTVSVNNSFMIYCGPVGAQR